MCITAAVGRGAKNHRDDVRTVQLLLRAAGIPGTSGIVADGHCGPETIAAIEHFQAAEKLAGTSSGVVDPEGSGTAGLTLESLRAATMWRWSADTLAATYLHATDAAIAKFVQPLASGMEAAGIATPLRRAHFLAQVGHESGELRYTEELASGAAYESRADLGNTEKGDGPRFKGRGLIQLTGRANYAKYGRACGQDFCAPEVWTRIATDPAQAVGVAIWFWQTRKLNDLADQDNILAITHRVNGGTNGLEDRERLLARAKWIFGVSEADSLRAKAAALARSKQGIAKALEAAEEVVEEVVDAIEDRLTRFDR